MEEHKTPVIPEYGFGGDQAGARRGRRSFRFIVMACVLLTGAMWFSDLYLRYDLTEEQYRMALTLETDSARAVLRNVVKRDKENNEVPNPKYMEALAAIEEDDVILSAYSEAYRLNPANAALLINYGCRLFMDGQYKDARERFRESSVLPPKNALPRYLEAAALAAGATTDEDLIEAIALVARTNNSGDPVIFPQPLWHSSLPARGAWYARARREIVDRCCAPLYRFRSQVVGKAKSDVDAGQVRDWVSWLKAIEVMGQRLVGNTDSDGVNMGSSQAMSGIQIQLDAIGIIARIQEIVDGKPDSVLLEKKIKLENALGLLKQFEAGRDEQVTHHRAVLRLPLQLYGWSFLLFLGLFFSASLLYRSLYSGRVCWTLAHTAVAQMVLAGGLLVLLSILLFFVFANDHGYINGWSPWCKVFWGLTVFALVGFGLVYPEITLPSAKRVLRLRSETPGPGELDLAALKHCRRMAYVSLIRRYYGILLGGFLLVLCVWIIVYRISEGLYPTQLPLLVSGLEDQELELVRQVQRLLMS